jgi:hypothetical protein
MRRVDQTRRRRFVRASINRRLTILPGTLWRMGNREVCIEKSAEVMREVGD